MAEPEAVRTTERWFIRQGLPLFVEEYSAGRDVWTRAVPVLSFLFVLNIVASITVARSVLGGVLLALVVVAALAAYGLLNVRAGRPWYALPQQLGFVAAHIGRRTHGREGDAFQGREFAVPAECLQPGRA